MLHVPEFLQQASLLQLNRLNKLDRLFDLGKLQMTLNPMDTRRKVLILVIEFIKQNLNLINSFIITTSIRASFKNM